MGSVSSLFSALIDAVTKGDLDITGLLSGLLSASSEQQQGGGGQ
ncbi:hypothetical protein [Rhodococcus sp. SGAir0479]|nr:hypothetical protein [Rhodococcus sp. SGAir0479]